MRRIAAYYLILLYVSSLLKPIEVWLSHAVTHMLADQKQLVVLHNEGGHNHIHYVMAGATKDDSSSSKASILKESDDINLPVKIVSASCFRNKDILIHYTYYLFHLPFVIIAMQVPPPRQNPFFVV